MTRRKKKVLSLVLFLTMWLTSFSTAIGPALTAQAEDVPVQKNIVSFAVAGQIGNSIIDESAHTVHFKVPFGTDLTALTPVISVSSGATISAASGVAKDFTTPVTYTVTSDSEADSPQTWTVTGSLTEKRITLDSSNVLLKSNFDWAIGQALEFVQTGKSGPVNVNKTTGGQPGPFPYIPSYWAGYKHRTAFYSRDFVHQAPGGHMLGLDQENFSMFKTFAKGATEARKWYTLWAYNFDGSNYTIDYKSDTNFVREVPIQFELIEKAYEQYLWTGNEAYINDSDMWNFYTKVLTDYIALHDTNGNGVAEGTGGGIFKGAASYNERSGEPIIEAGDAIGSQYQALLAYANMLKAKGMNAESTAAFAKAQDLKDYFNNEWSVKNGDKSGSYVRAWHADQVTRYTDFGKENSWFLPMKLITEPGQRNSNYLDYISEQIGNGLIYTSPTAKASLDKPNSPANVEAYSYLPDTFYPYNRVDEGWKWLKFLMETRPNRHEQFAAGTLTNGEYPEISYTLIGNIVEGLMGIEPNAPQHSVVTAPRLASEVPDVKVDFLQMGQNDISVAHKGNTKTEFINRAGSQPLTWEARFYGNYPTINLNGTDQPALHKTVNGEKVSYITTTVAVGSTSVAEVSTSGTADKAEAPVSDKLSGTFDKTIKVALSTSTPDAKIYYTLDGKTPTRNSNLYTGPFVIQKTAELKLFTASEYLLDSDVVSYAYTINAPIVEKPTPNMEAGTHSTFLSIELSTATAGADIYYTVDGTTPSRNSTKYVNPIAVTKTTTVKAIAFKEEWVDSDVATLAYAIVLPVVDAPAASKATGRYDEAFQVTLATGTEGATIYYTTNGDTPTKDSTLYTGAFEIAKSTTVKAIAVKDMYTNSIVASYAYRIVAGPLPEPASAPAYLSDLNWISATSGWAGHPPLKDHAINSATTPIKINGITYAKGIGTNATSIIKYNIGGGYGLFNAVIGIDDVQNKKGTATTLWFEVLGDGFSIYKSPTMNTVSGPAAGIPIEVDITGVNELTLIVNDAGTPTNNPSNSDHGDWADAQIIPRVVPVTGVTVSKTELSLTKGEKSTLQAAILPANATNHDVEWSTSSSAVATVSSEGEVTAIAPGKATITLTSKDGGFKATTTVTVHAKQITTVDLKGNITVHIDTDAAGKANVVLSANDMNTAAAKTTNKLINIMIKPDAGTKEVAILAPVADLKQNTGLVINTGSANTFIPSDMLVNKNGTDAVVLELSVKQVDKDKLPPTAQTFTLQNTALDFNLILDGKTISDFGGRSVEINLPYTLKMGEDPNEMVVYFINNEGKLEIVKNRSYNSATSNVHFSVKQFGKYAVAAVN